GPHRNVPSLHTPHPIGLILAHHRDCSLETAAVPPDCPAEGYRLREGPVLLHPRHLQPVPAALPAAQGLAARHGALPRGQFRVPILPPAVPHFPDVPAARALRTHSRRAKQKHSVFRYSAPENGIRCFYISQEYLPGADGFWRALFVRCAQHIAAGFHPDTPHIAVESAYRIFCLSVLPAPSCNHRPVYFPSQGFFGPCKM